MNNIFILQFAPSWVLLKVLNLFITYETWLQGKYWVLWNLSKMFANGGVMANFKTLKNKTLRQVKTLNIKYWYCVQKIDFRGSIEALILPWFYVVQCLVLIEKRPASRASLITPIKIALAGYFRRSDSLRKGYCLVILRVLQSPEISQVVWAKCFRLLNYIINKNQQNVFDCPLDKQMWCEWQPTNERVIKVIFIK